MNFNIYLFIYLFIFFFWGGGGERGPFIKQTEYVGVYEDSSDIFGASLQNWTIFWTHFNAF